jgi:hypothetical protein
VSAERPATCGAQADRSRRHSTACDCSSRRRHSAQADDEWAVQCARYMTLETITSCECIDMHLPAGLPAGVTDCEPVSAVFFGYFENNLMRMATLQFPKPLANDAFAAVRKRVRSTGMRTSIVKVAGDIPKGSVLSPDITRPEEVPIMAGYYPQDQGEWLLQIGQSLRFDYADIIAAPLPERLTALLKQLEEATDSPRQAA